MQSLLYRFTTVPPFGLDSIQCFPDNVADTTQCPAWFFENVLQVRHTSTSMTQPVTTIILIVCSAHLERLAASYTWWHSSNPTIPSCWMACTSKAENAYWDSLAFLQQALWQLGTEMRRFQHVTCLAFAIKELPCEMAQRHQRETATLLSGHHQKSMGSLSLLKVFNINTYKFHALGDYEHMIRLFRTTNSYMTQVISLQYPDLHVSHIDLKWTTRVNGHTSWSKNSTVPPTRKMSRTCLLGRNNEKHFSGGNLPWMNHYSRFKESTPHCCYITPWPLFPDPTMSSTFLSSFRHITLTPLWR